MPKVLSVLSGVAVCELSIGVTLVGEEMASVWFVDISFPELKFIYK